MLIKKRTTNYKYLGMQMLYERLPNDHAMKNIINSKIKAAEAGIIGEATVEDVFKKHDFPFNYNILHDVNLTSNGKFQIDTLFICQYFIVILECKNIVGKLYFESNPPCLKRELDSGKEDPFPFRSPEMQVDRSTYLLREWLNKRGINIPIVGVIIFSSTKSIVKKAPNHTAVIYASNIPVYIRKLQRQKEYLTVAQMKEVSETIMQHNHPYIPYPMCKKWGIEPAELIKGVKCNKCGRFEMEKKSNGWNCSVCGNIDRLAHLFTVHEWFALVSHKITNKECRNFLCIESHQLAGRILNSMNLSRKGKSKNTTHYILEWEKLDNCKGRIDEK
ncbi:nuclease-related domain-containing protein [Psychrobacillus sp. NEAU-3TGS]|uniref:nuclease-related domain-containing protein n=1 Tax=Psychrobacillus sp. NEAU-3TGS TaxID=2995412 RepID=UPI0024966F5E|nr:nuclease-related domain-containing protein [Psychrobacillus sp. NEAU-3TGS]MDI2587000.1 nuclease-related domain-containing protein [Psychrobacillus sp. NEAU-3TGS]